MANEIDEDTFNVNTELCPPSPERRPKSKKTVPSLHAAYEGRLAKCRNLNDLLIELGIARWDYLLIGDGSGSTFEHECGWGTTLIEAISGKYQEFWGSLSAGTNNIGEMMAYVHPLLWIASRKHASEQIIHVITDSQIVANCGNGKQRRTANAELWSMFDAFRRGGMSLKFHWIPRDTVDLNRLADALANQARLSAMGRSEAAWTIVEKKYGLRMADVHNTQETAR